MSKQSSIRVSSYLLERLETFRPEWKTTPRFIEDLLAESLIGLTPSPLTIPPTTISDLGNTGLERGRGGLDVLEENSQEGGEGERKGSKKKIDPFARKSLKLSQVPQELTFVAELLVEFWNVKKGTRSQAVFSRVTNKLLAWSRDDQKKALETAITNGWGDVFEPKLDRPKQAPWAEPQMKHPAHRDFTAERLERERNEAEEEIPSATGGRGVLEALGHAF